jgi:hypothetical protein
MADLAVMIASVKREIAMRQRNYPRWVESGRLRQAEADREIAAMRDVLTTLVELEAAAAAHRAGEDARAAIHLALDEPAFRTLCAGGIVEKRGVLGDRVRLILSDIGVERMLQAVCDGTHSEDLARQLTRLRAEGGGR